MIGPRLAPAACALAAVLATGCPGPAGSDGGADTPAPSQELPASQPAARPGGEAPAKVLVVGPVREAHPAAQYTYLAVEGPEGVVGAAAPAFEVPLGDVVRVHAGLPMPNFHSDTLGRTFELVHFVERVELEERVAPLSLAELLAARKRLAGAVVTTHGRVERVTKGVLGANWVHVVDADGNEVTATTSAEPATDALVRVRGRVLLDRDFGHGYRYETLLGEGEVTAVEALPAPSAPPASEEDGPGQVEPDESAR